MDSDIDLILGVLRNDVKVKQVNENSVDTSHGFREVVINRNIFNNCPDISKLINRFEKKILRTSSLKSYRHTRQLCILLMISSGYSVNSSIFDNITNVFIEKCWECIQYISYSINEPTKSWLIGIMNGRSPPSFSALFCPPRQLPDRIQIDSIITNKVSIVNTIDSMDGVIPAIVWHRDDIVTQTILSHLRHQSRSF